MNPSTTVQNMLANKRIVVPAYQRAYSWETPNPTSTRTTQTEEHQHSPLQGCVRQEVGFAKQQERR